jgi:hypothetical protein
MWTQEHESAMRVEVDRRRRIGRARLPKRCDPMLNAVHRQGGMYAHWVELGVYFGYPTCCIIFFCTKWMDIPDDEKVSHFKFRIRPGAEHVRCDNCIEP